MVVMVSLCVLAAQRDAQPTGSQSHAKGQASDDCPSIRAPAGPGIRAPAGPGIRAPFALCVRPVPPSLPRARMPWKEGRTKSLGSHRISGGALDSLFVDAPYSTQRLGAVPS